MEAIGKILKDIFGTGPGVCARAFWTDRLPRFFKTPILCTNLVSCPCSVDIIYIMYNVRE